jgi:hypothetical protein
MATPTALLIQKNGDSVATAWPQVTPNGIGGQNLDLIQIVGEGLDIVAVVDFAGTVLGPAGLTLTQVAVSGATTTYTGTITGGSANALVGKKLQVSGFVNAGNNIGGEIITASNATTITVTTTTQVNETHAAKAFPYTGRSTRVGRFYTRLDRTSTLAQIFADVWSNPGQLDIIQVVQEGGNAHYNLDYLGVAHGS